MNVGLYLQRAALYTHIDRYIAAIADYNRAARLDPSLVDEKNLGIGEVRYAAGQAHLTRRYIYLNRKNAPLAARHLQLAQRDMRLAVQSLSLFLEKHAQHSQARVTRARALEVLGRHLQASDDYTAAINAEPNSPSEYYYERAQALLASGPQNSERALEAINEGIKKLGPVVTLQLLAKDIEVSINRYVDAVSRLEYVISQAERKDVWLTEKGQILLKAGRADAANDAFKTALAEIETLPIGIRSSQTTRSRELVLRNALKR